MGGRLLWVSTAMTPPTFMASLKSIFAMRPFAIVDETTLTKARFCALNSPAYLAAPVTFSRPSTRAAAVPMQAVMAGSCDFLAGLILRRPQCRLRQGANDGA